MKVLMFGWEFPPHISGGLGTACYGLTSALVKEPLEIIFVVPKLYGNEPDNGITLVNASEVSTPQRTSAQYTHDETITPTDLYPEHTTTRDGITTIEIPSSLSAYTMAGIDLVYDLQHWNYEQTEKNVEPVTDHHEKHGSTIITSQDQTYEFKGGYGEQLIEEVYRYAQVGAKLAEQYNVDVIHAHDWMTFPAAIAAKKTSGKPLVVHVHATEYDRAGKHGNPNVYNIEKEAVMQADRVIAVSRWTKDLLVKNYRIRASKIDVVHNGIIPQVTSDMNKEAAIHAIGKQVVTFLGRITYQKGPEYFVEAAKKVSERFPDAHFIMAGSGDFLPQIISMVAKFKLSSRFHFTGFLRKLEMDTILSYTRVYVMPSVSEPFGITPLEAVQAGVPVIISNQSGVGEVMGHALKVDFWDTDALSQAICSVLQYKSLSDTLKKNSAEEINTVTWDKAAKKLNLIYHELTSTI